MSPPARIDQWLLCEVDTAEEPLARENVELAHYALLNSPLLAGEIFIRKVVMKHKYKRYQDYVIKNGKLVGEFDQMYQDHDDPWEQSKETFATDKMIVLHLLKKYQISSCLEIGCGHGYFTNEIRKIGIKALGVDISPTAIDTAKSLFPETNFSSNEFSNMEIYSNYDAILMLEITWYILAELENFLSYFKSHMKNKYLIHCLTTYPEGKQLYGKDYFTKPTEILKYFDLHYLEHGLVANDNGLTRNFFIAKVKN